MSAAGIFEVTKKILSYFIEKKLLNNVIEHDELIKFCITGYPYINYKSMNSNSNSTSEINKFIEELCQTQINLGMFNKTMTKDRIWRINYSDRMTNHKEKTIIHEEYINKKKLLYTKAKKIVS